MGEGGREEESMGEGGGGRGCRWMRVHSKSYRRLRCS